MPIKGEPSLRQFAFQQQRNDSLFDAGACLRNASIKRVNGLTGMSRACDGAHCLDRSGFCEALAMFWRGTVPRRSVRYARTGRCSTLSGTPFPASDSAMSADSDFQAKAAGLIEAGRFFFRRGWVPATSSNFSARLDGEQAAVTRSGAHKGRLAGDDIMRVDLAGNSLEAGKRPSAETLLHTTLYGRDPAVGCVLHTHSVNATVLSRLSGDVLEFSDYELQKAFSGVTTHAGRLQVPVFENDQDIPRLAARVLAWLEHHPETYGYLIAGHGLYTWGAGIADAVRHVEAFEFLLECELLTRRLQHE